MVKLKFSVLMSLYIKEMPSNLERCLESLMQQTLIADEVVIVYDGSITKELDDIVNKYIDLLNIIKVKIPKNVGLGNALNEGIKYCNYNIIARMDTDDACVPTRFMLQIPEFQDGSLTLLGGAIREINESGDIRIKSLPVKQKDIVDFSLLKNPFNHMTVVFRKDKVVSVGGYQHHLYMEDYNLWLRLLGEGCKVRNLSDIVVDASVNDSTMKRRRGIDYIKSELKLFKIKNEIKLYPLYKILSSLIIRVVVRVFPIGILKILYVLDRKKTNE